MPFITRYNTTTNGAITFTGNSLGLSKLNNANAPGTAHSIGTFITVDTSLRDNTYPLGTTASYLLNSSAAQLRLPVQSVVLYAELIWGGSYSFGGENVAAALNNAVKLTNNAGTFNITPEAATATTFTSRAYYIRSANVTSFVQQGGGGTYIVGGVPGTQGNAENAGNACGWTLAVVYQNASLPSRNMTVFVGSELVDNPTSTAAASVSGFSTPTSGPLSGRLLVSAVEGDSAITGDQMQFGPTVASLSAVFGPNNVIDNFFSSQINGDTGLLDTSGTFGTLNHPLGGAASGARQGWDITNIDVSSKLVNSQTSAFLRGTTTGDVYIINGLALQVNINAPVLAVTKSVNRTTAFLNEIITFTVQITNTGNATATNLNLKDNDTPGTTFIANSVTVNGTTQPGVDPYIGMSLGSIANGQRITVTYQSQVTNQAFNPPRYDNQVIITYQFQSVTGGTLFNGTVSSNTASVAAGNNPPVTSDVTGTIAEDTLFSSQITATDPEGAPLIYTLGAPPSNGTVTLNGNGSFIYTPRLNYHGTDSFSVTVSDGRGGSAVSRVIITVTPVNDPPVVSDVNDSTSEDTPTMNQIVATDVDGDPLTYSLNTPPSNGTAVVTPGGGYTYIPDLNFNGVDSFTVLVSDGNGGSAVATVTVTVTPVNDPPVAADAEYTIAEDTTLSGTITGTDVDGDVLTMSLQNSPVHGTVVVNADGTFLYTPFADYNGQDQFTVLVSDGQGGTDSATVTITVTPVNDPPAALDVSDTTAEDIPSVNRVIATDVDGDTLTFLLGDPPSNGTVVVNSDGTYTYTPNPDYNGTDQFTVVVSDGNGGTDTATVTIAVTPVNDYPVTADVFLTTPEDTQVSGQVPGTDVDGDVLTYSLETSPTNGVVTVNADGAFTYTPQQDFNGFDSFTVRVNDGQGGTAESNVAITVTPVNDAPVAQDVTETLPEDTTTSGKINALDVDGDTLTFSLLSGAANGLAVVNPDGTYTYTPNADYNGPDSFSVLVDDGNGGTDTATVSITVTPVNDPPVTSDVTLTTPEDVPVTGLVTAADVDGDALIVVVFTGPTHGTVLLNGDGTFTYTPFADYNGIDSFTVQFSDGNGGTAQANVFITVTPVNDPPVAMDLTDTTAEDVPSENRVTATDVDGDALTFTLTVPAENGTVTLNPDGSYIYTPDPNFNGVDTFTVTVDDGNGGTDTAVVTINVTPVNDPPVVSDVNLTTPEDTAVDGQVIATDVDGDPLTALLLTVPGHGTAVVSLDGAFTYTPNQDYNGTDTFTVQISDGQGGTAEASIFITVTPVNDAPVAIDVFDTTSEDLPSTNRIQATDVDGDVLTYTISTAPTNGTVTVNPDGTYTYTPNPDYNGTDVFTVLVDDGNGGTDTATVTIVVSPVNDPPAAADVTLTTPEDTAVGGQITATDVDGDSLAYRVLTPPSRGAVALETDGTFLYTPFADLNGTDTFTVEISDGQGGTAEAGVTIIVTPVNDPPVAADISDTTAEDIPSTGKVSATDADGDIVIFSLNTPPANGTAVVNPDGTYTYTPAPDFNGTDSFTVLADDGNGGTDTATVTIQVTPVNDPPVTADITVTLPEDTVAAGQVTATDVDGDSLTFALNTPPSYGVVNVAVDGTFTYTPNADFHGQDSFTVRVSDGNGGTAEANVTLLITLVNDPPVAMDVADTTSEDTVSNGQVTATDVDGDPLTYVLATGPANGTVIVQADGSYTYTPALNFNGVDSFTVEVSDGNGGTDLAVVTVTVVPVNDPPTAPDQALTTPEDTPLSGSIGATDVDGDALTYVIVSPAEHGTFTLNADGTFQYVPNPDFNGIDTVMIQVSDGNGGTAESDIVITVTPVNDAPVAEDISFAVRQDSSTISQVTATDVDGDTLTYALLIAPVNGTAVVAADGSLVYTPAPGFTGSDSFTVIASDGNGGTDTATVSVFVYPTINDDLAQDVSLTTDEDTPVSGTVPATPPVGNTLVFGLFSPPVHGNAAVNPDGTFTYTPNDNYHGVDSFAVLVSSDPDGQSDISVISITVAAVNDAPVAEDASLTIAEDKLITQKLNALDVDGDVLKYSLATEPVNGTASVDADGNYTYTPNPNFNGTDVFTILVEDPGGLSDTATINVTILPVNDAPVTTNVSLTSPEGTLATGQIEADDVDGDPLTFSLNTSPSYGSAAVNLDGTFTYSPNAFFHGTDSFTVLVSDGRGGTALSNVTVTVTPVNDPPVALDVSDFTSEDVPSNGQVTATDVDGDALTFSLNTPPANGSAVVNPDGSYTYTPAPDFNGTDSFTVLVDDGNGGTDIAVVTVQITPVNDPPVASDLSLATTEDTAVGGQVTATDVDGDTLVFQLLTEPSRGVVSMNPDGTFTYTPDLDFNGPDTFTVQVTDGNGGTDEASVFITVTPVNDAPVALDLEDTTAEDIPSIGQLSASDVDGDALVYSLNTPPTRGTAVVNPDGAYTYTPDANFNGTDSFTFLVSDGNGGNDTGTVTIAVTPVNDPPVASDVSLITLEDTPVNGQVTATDVDGDVLVYDIFTPASNGTVLMNPDGSFTYTPNLNFNGVDTFTVQVSDGNGGTNEASVSVTITPVNDPPAAYDVSDTTSEDVSTSGSVSALDPDRDVITFTLITPPANGTAAVSPDGSYTYTPNPDYNGTDSFVVQADDGNGGTDTATVTIEITPVNDPPVAEDVNVTTAEDTPVSGQVTATDVDGDTITFQLFTPPSQGTVILNLDGTFTYTPNPNYNGPDTFTVQASDGNGGTDEASVIITVTPVNDAPVAFDLVNTTSEDVPSSGRLAATDVDGDPLTFSLVTPPVNGTVVVEPDGNYTYTPNPDYNGTDAFTIRVEDGNGGSDEAVITMVITPVNDAPVAPDLNITTLEDTPVGGQVAATDVDGDVLIYVLTSLPTNGAVTLNAVDGSFTYTPNQDFNGTDSFAVTVDDGNGGTDEANVSIVITPVNDPPTAFSVSDQTSEDRPSYGQVIAFDVDGDPLTFSLSAPPTNGTAVVNPDGSYIYTPNPNFNGLDVFPVLVDDGNGGSTIVTVTVQVNVTPVNDPPVITDITLTLAEDTAVTGQAAATDVDGDSLTYALFTSPSNGVAVVNSDGTFTYTPNQDFNGPDTFTILVSDGNGGTAAGSVFLTITPVNDPPVLADAFEQISEDTVFTSRLQGMDVDGDSLTYSLSAPPLNGNAIVETDGSYVYTPNVNYNGTDTFEVRVDDGNGAFDTAVVTITILPVNDPPLTADMFITTAEDTPVTGQVSASDVDGDSLTFTLWTPPSNGTVNLNANGELTYFPFTDFNGMDSFTVQVDDGNGGTAISGVYITVTPVNDAPVGIDVFDTTDEDVPSDGLITATDVDGDPLTFALDAGPVNGTVTVAPDGSYRYVPNPDYHGTDVFTVTVSDGQGGEDKVTVTIEVRPVNDSPIAEDLVLTTDEDTPVTASVTASDVDGDALVFSLNTEPANGTVAIRADGTFTYTPNPDYNGPDGFTVFVTDGNGGSDVANIILTVTPVNDPPNVVSESLSTLTNLPFDDRIKAEDPDSSALTYLLSATPVNGTVDLRGDGTYTYTPDLNFSGLDSFQVTVSDEDGGSSVSTVEINIVPLVTALEAMLYTLVNTPVSSSFPVNLEVIVASVLSVQPANGTATVFADGTFTYVPNPDFIGNDFFTISVNGIPAFIQVNVIPNNQPPIFNDIAIITSRNRSVQEQIVAFDLEGSPVTYALTTPPSHGTAQVGIDGILIYTPNRDFTGTDFLTVAAADAEGAVTYKTLYVTVEFSNVAPNVPDLFVSASENGSASGMLSAYDEDGDVLIYQIFGGPANGIVTLRDDGTFIYQANQGFNGTDTFIVSVRDAFGGEDTAIVTVIVGGMQSPPEVSPVNAGLSQGGTITGRLPGYDPEGGQIRFTLLRRPANGTAIIGDGIYTYTPDSNFIGRDSFIVRATSSVTGLSSDIVITIEVYAGAEPGKRPPLDRVPDEARPGNTARENQGENPEDRQSENQGLTRRESNLVFDADNEMILTRDYDVFTAENQPVSGIAIARSTTGRRLRYFLGIRPDHGRADVSPDGSWMYTPDSRYVGKDEFVIRVTDGERFNVSRIRIVIEPTSEE
ncbi:tandem-95 repeat protein [Paenibacillus swuensis]|uniref:tandem-95 repeat protein n=1 Tax=Paenibacillus swuensis TaxID=1178515 RepID=UPI00083903ED|nr:Ig-like domain-containing protein [Paenibacillus swuensis]